MKITGQKLVSAALAGSLLFVAACSADKTKDAAPNGAPAGSPSAAESSKSPDAKEEYVIKVLTQTNNQIKRSDETKIGKKIKEKFNMVFEYVQAPGNYADKLNLMLAGGDYPEIVSIQDNATFDKYARAGALLPIDDLVKKSPEFAERYKVQIPLWKLSGHDGKLYKWESAVPADFRNVVEVNDVGVRIDVLEQQGWPQLLSTDDYIKFLTKGLEDNPTTNGKKTIGMIVPFGEP
jgi:ABC-type glycerol-3-phosphate transport system substrate-binding protein